MASVPSASYSSSSPPPTPPPLSLPITRDSGGSTRHQRRRTRSSCSSSSVSSPSSFSSFSSFSSGASYLSCPLAPSSPSPTSSSLSSVPFSWEDQPGVPKTKAPDDKPAVDKNNPATTTNKSAIRTSGEVAGYRKVTPTSPGRSISNGSSKVEPLSPPSKSHHPLRPPPLRSYSDRFGFSASFHCLRRLGLPDPGYVRDPFTVALIQCSKHRASEEHDGDDDDDDSVSASWKLLPTSAPATPTTSSSKQQRRRRQPAKKDPHGGSGGTTMTGNKLFTSCKTSCAVVESAAILIPRATRPGKGAKAYDLLRQKPM